MLHAFPRTFAHRDIPARRDCALLPLTPAAYLKLRREAAGLSIATVARLLNEAHATLHPDRRNDMTTALIASLESPGVVARHHETLDALRAVFAFAFDPDVYRQLATEPADRHPRVCRGCGCSAWDARDEMGEGLAWATDSACTRCLPGPARTIGTFQ